MIRVLRARCAPTLPDLVTRPLENFFVSRVFPQDQILDDLEKSLAFFFLRLLRLENIWMRRGVVHHLRKDHRPCRRQRPPRPPQVQGARMPMPDRLLPRRGLVDSFKWQSHFNEFFLV